MTDKKLTVVLAPGVLEQLEEDMSPEELQLLMDELKNMGDHPESLEAFSSPINMNELKESDPALYASIVNQLEALEAGGFDEPVVH